METCVKCRNMTVMLQNRRHIKSVLGKGPSTLVVFGLMVLLAPVAQTAGIPLESMLLSKRMASPTATDLSGDDGFTDYQTGVRYDEYPVVVPKRAALIIDRILKEIESAKDNSPIVNDWSPISRRGNNKEKLYFRCYFNAVSCYKKK